MYELPASVRLSLWLTHAFAFGRPVTDAIREALPDLDDVDPDDVGLARLAVWRDFGERFVCVDLPRPGVHGGLLPPGSEGADAAMEAGECLFVPSLGGVLVPRLAIYGPSGDEGLSLRFETYDSAPVPRHRLEALAIADVDRRLRTSLLAHVDALESLDVAPFLGSRARADVDARLSTTRWALPPGIGSRVTGVITTSGTIIAAIDEAMRSPGGALRADDAARRDTALRGVLAEAELALAEAATIGAMELAGLR